VREVLETSPVATTPEPSAAMVSWLAKVAERESSTDLRAQAERVFVSAIRARKTGVLHLVDAKAFPFAGSLPWETGDLVGVSMPVSGALPALGDRVPEVIVVDPKAAGFPKSKRVVTIAFDAIVAEAAASVAARVANGGPVEVDGALDAVRSALGARGVSPVEGASGKRVIVTASTPAEIRAGDVIVSLANGAARTALVDQARKAGASVLVPPIAAQIAAAVQAELAIARAVEEGKAQDGLVPPTIAAGAGEAIVDDPRAPRVVLDGKAPFEKVAATRARALLQGRGRL